MNLDQFQRAQLATFAFREAASTGSIASMKAVCYCIANRVQPWHNGSWLAAIEEAHQVAAHEPNSLPLSLDQPALLGILREIEDVYFGGGDDDTRKVVGKCLYWCVIDGRPIRPWFRDHIIRMPNDHPQRGQVGTIFLYE